MSQTVREIMSAHEVTVTSSETIARAAVMMKEHNIGFLPVVEQDKLLGVLTDRDLVIRGLAANLDAKQPIAGLFTREVISCRPDTTVEQAADMMAEQQVHRLLVTDGDRLLGVITLSDLSREVSGRPVAGKALSGISQR